LRGNRASPGRRDHASPDSQHQSVQWRGRKVFEQFVKKIVKPSGGELYLSVRKDNKTACDFYERHGMKVVGTVAWKRGTVSGLVYRLPPERSAEKCLYPCCDPRLRLVIPFDIHTLLTRVQVSSGKSA
jgi:hypothetical protein